MKHCFAYTRVSTIKQGDGVSLEAQHDAIVAYATKHNLKIVKWFEEKETAAKSGRPIFNAMIRELKCGAARGLLMHKIDRSARNFADWAKIGDLADAGIDIYFATESLDFRSRGGRLTADIQAVIAADYIRNLRDETIKGINGRLKQGLYPFRAPIGYLDRGAGQPKVPDPQKAPHIKNAFALYASGEHSLASLHEHMAKAGLKSITGGPVSLTGIETILNNPFYCGLIRIKKRGETYPGIHEPLISPALFKTVQDVKAGRHVGKRVTRHNHAFRGLFQCQHCLTGAIGERQKGHVYYRCHTRGCQTKTIREEVLDAAIANTLKNASLSEPTTRSLQHRLRRWLQLNTPTTALASLKATQQRLTARLDKLTDALLDELLDRDTFNAKRESLLFELAACEQDIVETEANRGTIATDLEKFLELVTSLYSMYTLALPGEKRQLVQLATSNRTVSGRNAFVEPQKWLQQACVSLAALNGAPDQDTSRNGHEVPNEHLTVLGELVRNNEVQQLVEMTRQRATESAV